MADQQLYFDDVQVGDAIPRTEYGPLTIADSVRWAGVQENWGPLHWDREHVRQHNGLRTFIASGDYRQALLARSLTDWIGPRGWLRTFSVRYTAPTYEGDLMRYEGRVVEKSDDPDAPWIACDLEGSNQDDQRTLTGRCTILLPRRDHAASV
ncbi:MAG TPA: MaoC/PaaZ C-terminal domain-containing protein [Chloroflexota bacterium]|nr:MaoC/PaaZ C-terminal domain-containing protein [Chloroflexota bacterium]